MCATCDAFTEPLELESSVQLDSLLSRLHRDGIVAGALQVADGCLAWADHIDCLLVCRSCGRRFRLRCETYHGRGGRFGPDA